MDNYRKTVNNRSEFARQKYAEIIKSFTITKNGNVIDGIAGYKARKLNQAYQIYVYYLFAFNASKPRGTAVYKVIEQSTAKRKHNRYYKSRRQLLSE